ncbi:hypothetical protein VQL36_08770 [Chengkuizengella sp. SCS-71B]|uniref:hypothetical protein n=1 Tax=Chengkuizengella sp. SCS-71B TaxID=3115290 RepID=UPI0032C249C9
MGSYSGSATGAAIVLVLFILLVIILIASRRPTYSKGVTITFEEPDAQDVFLGDVSLDFF